MYPFVRLFWQIYKHKKMPPLGPLEANVSHHYCLPWDIDLWMELNNGRTLTLYDLGRIPYGSRVGLLKALAKNRWGLTMAGASVRYRRRIRMFEKIEMHSQIKWWDDKFMYIEQSMWKKDGECANQVLYRVAVTDTKGIVAPKRVIEAMGIVIEKPDVPAWISAWIEADAQRVWPPEK